MRAKNPSDAIRAELQSAQLNVVTNTSDATVALFTCRDRSSLSITQGGQVEDDVAKYCVDIKPFHPGVFDVGADGTGLVVAITPHRSGVVHILGVHVHYRDGMRSGALSTGSDLTITTP